MSGLAGVLWLDDRPAHAGQVTPLLHWQRHRGPDGLHAVAQPPCVLGFASNITTPEAASERQPASTPDGRVWLTFDGRLDDREALADTLDVSRTAGDAALVLAAYERWAGDCVERLLGDFAFALWDARKRRLLLARDVFGLRPLLYRRYMSGFWWASEQQALAHLGDARVNEGMVGEYLADRYVSQRETLVEGVCRLPRARLLTVERDGRTRERVYWEPRVPGIRRYPDRRQHDEEFRALFAEAVRCRLRSDRPVALMLSGGIDSSCIAGQALELARAGTAAPLECFSLASPGQPVDDGPAIAAAVAHLGLQTTVRHAEGPTFDAVRADITRTLDIGETYLSLGARPMRRAIRERGHRAVLHGGGGDEWFTGTWLTLADDLACGRLDLALRRLWTERHTRGRPGALAALRLAVWMQLPERARSVLRKTLRVRATPPWIAAPFADRTRLEERLRAEDPAPPLPDHSSSIVFRWAVSGLTQRALEADELLDASYGFEQRSPFYDRRLVEWSLGLPPDQRSQGGWPKVLLRRAGAAWLSPLMQARRAAADSSYLEVRSLQDAGGGAHVADTAQRRADWVVPREVDMLWREMLACESSGSPKLGRYSAPVFVLVATDLACAAIAASGKGLSASSPGATLLSPSAVSE